jgi:integrase
MARLYKRGKVWWFQFRGKRVSTRCTDRTAADLARREIERRRADPTYRPTNETTVSKCLKKFVAHQQGREKAEGTIEMHERHVRHLARVLGANTALAAVHAAEVDGYTAQRIAEGAARSSVGKELSTLRGALKLARRHREYPYGLDEVMPNGFSLEYVPGTRHLREPQVQKLLDKLPPKRRAIVAFIVATGADLGSVDTAKRRDVNLSKNTVKVWGTKNSKRERTIPILPIFEDLVRYAAEHMPFEPWSNVRRDLTVACRRAGVPRVTPRDLRRTHGSILRQRGVEPHLIGKMLGHGDSRMVERVYGQLPADSLGGLIEFRIGAGTQMVQSPADDGGKRGARAQKKRRKGTD